MADRNFEKDDLKSIATYQRIILVCILINLLSYLGLFFVPPALSPLVGLGYFAVAIVAAVFIFMLALKLYSTAIGVILAILTLIPCIGLLTLLVINGKATGVLKEHGIKVGLLGANPSSIE